MRLKLLSPDYDYAPLRRSISSMNYKNLNYEIETTLSRARIGVTMNYKNLNYEIETTTVAGVSQLL